MRHSPKLLTLAFVLFLLSAIRIGARQQDWSDPPQALTQRPAWLKQGIVMVGSWEPLTFILRRGGQETNAGETWNAERTPESVRRLRELGVNLVVVNLHKGFGLKAEAADIQATRNFVKLAHQSGIRVGGYIGSTMGYETFFTEEPAARDWVQVDESGRPIYYSQEQTFRYAACRNNPGYKAFVERLLRLGVEDIGLDLIHFDQMQWWAEPLSCRCIFCKEQFLEFLQARYRDPQRAYLRFGFVDLSHMAPPPYNVGAGPIRFAELKNPLMQEWAMFRAASIARRYAEYDAFIRKLNPAVALEGNPNINLALNQGFAIGTDCGQLLQHGDVVWSEEPNHAAWTGDGRIVSKVRSFKAARIMGKSLFVYTGSRYGRLTAASPPELRMAEALAYNDVNLGMVGDLTPTGTELTPSAQRYIRFFHSHVKDLVDTSSHADVAVLRSFASVEFSPAQANVSTVLFEQTLLQNKIPFDIIFSQHLDQLRRYKVLILANQDALSDEELSRIRAFVNDGGGLVATENSSLLNEWRLRRPRFGLAELFGIDAPSATPVQRPVGEGRVVYLPLIARAAEPPPATMNYNFANEYWKLPTNHPELIAAVTWAAKERLTVSVQAPLSVAAELVEQRSSGNWILHLVNFDFTRPVKDIAVTLRLPEGRDLKEVVVETPDSLAPQVLKASSTKGVISFRAANLRVYSLVRLTFFSPGH
jgi:hypothetical protein